jgi:hypothetical protein
LQDREGERERVNESMREGKERVCKRESVWERGEGLGGESVQ